MEKQEALSSERFISLRQPGVSQFHFHPTQQVKRFPRFIKPEAMKLDDVYKLASSDKMMHSKKLFEILLKRRCREELLNQQQLFCSTVC